MSTNTLLYASRMSPELTTYLKEIAASVAATEQLFSQSEAAVSESDIRSATENMQELTKGLQEFVGNEKRLATKHLGDALELIGQGRDAARRRWDDERQA